MKTVGIIAEFNPFHNGHKYLIEQAKRMTNADSVVVVCSGNYVQRGTPSVFDKFQRAEMAIQNGVDAFFELPVFYATASAELFARASVKFLTDLNCVDYLCFGCETNDISELWTVASILSDEPEAYKKYLSDYLKSGVSFPKARMNAFNKYCKSVNISLKHPVDSLLSQPNNILAIEYLKALKYFNSSILPFPIQRRGAGYDSLDLHTEFASATGIRKALKNKMDVTNLVPENCVEIIRNASAVTTEDFDTVFGYKLLVTENFEQYLDVSAELSNRINHYKSVFTDITSFITQIQSKNFTHSGISRALIHILLDIKKSDIESFIRNDYFVYARLLGLNKNSDILSRIKKHSRLDIISKLSSYYSQCTGISRKMLDLSIHADELYRMICMNRYKKIIPTEFERQIIVKS